MPTTTSTLVLDDALATFHRFRHEYAGGLSSHGPMVVESMEHAGLQEHIAPWTASYAAHLDPVGDPTPAPAEPPALGNADAVGWTAWFAAQLAERDWRDVVAEWVPALVPGSVGAAGHGILRAAHAVRSLERSDAPVRVAELAHGLGYWASTSHVLPGSPATGDLLLDQALAGVPATVSDAWFISERVWAIDGSAFGPAVARAALPSDATDALSAVIDLAARVLIANPQGAIAFIHAVTVPSAARHLVPHTDDATRRAVAEQAWWVLAALWSAYGTNPPVTMVPDAPAWADLVAAALRRGDEHDIKLTVAARDQVAHVDDDLLRAAVASVVA